MARTTRATRPRSPTASCARSASGAAWSSTCASRTKGTACASCPTASSRAGASPDSWSSTWRSGRRASFDRSTNEERMELGIYSFGETTPDPVTGYAIRPGERIRNLLEEIELADQVGLDVFGVGEHHRPDFIVSAPAIVLAAAAARTERIRLTSAVTVLSSDAPVRVFQQFATLDLISRGRAEIMVGRGSFVESFPLFGYDLADY